MRPCLGQAVEAGSQVAETIQNPTLGPSRNPHSIMRSKTSRPSQYLNCSSYLALQPEFWWMHTYWHECYNVTTEWNEFLMSNSEIQYPTSCWLLCVHLVPLQFSFQFKPCTPWQRTWSLKSRLPGFWNSKRRRWVAKPTELERWKLLQQIFDHQETQKGPLAHWYSIKMSFLFRETVLAMTSTWVNVRFFGNQCIQPRQGTALFIGLQKLANIGVVQILTNPCFPKQSQSDKVGSVEKNCENSDNHTQRLQYRSSCMYYFHLFPPKKIYL